MKKGREIKTPKNQRHSYEPPLQITRTVLIPYYMIIIIYFVLLFLLLQQFIINDPGREMAYTFNGPLDVYPGDDPHVLSAS